MKVLVIGGTRFSGKQLVSKLTKRGHNVTIFSRGQTRPQWTETIKCIWGDRQDPAALKKALSSQEFEAVFDNIAYTPEDVETFQKSAQGWAGRYFLTSTAWVYAVTKPEIGQALTESSWSPEDFISQDVSRRALQSQKIAGLSQQYILGKLAAEKMAFSMNIPVTILRPSMVSGAQDHTGRLTYFFKDRPGLENRETFQLLWVEDLARAMVDLLEIPSKVKSVFNVAPPEEVSRKDLRQWVREVLSSGGFPDRMPIPQDDPLISPVHGSFDSSWLRAALPSFRFTGTQEWVKKSSIEMVEQGTQNLKTVSRL